LHAYLFNEFLQAQMQYSKSRAQNVVNLVSQQQPVVEHHHLDTAKLKLEGRHREMKPSAASLFLWIAGNVTQMLSAAETAVKSLQGRILALEQDLVIQDNWLCTRTAPCLFDVPYNSLFG
jgi:hypothetical protein